MDYQTVQVELDGGVASVWLNRPDVRNAFNELAIAEITHLFNALGGDQRVAVIVLGARGPAFCAGADLNWMKQMAAYSDQENRADAARLAAMLVAIHTCPQPVVARVQGDCYAGGMGLVAACDIAVAADDVQFCLSEVKLGLIPATISPYVIKAMGEQAARRYFLTAERFSAAEALRVGMLHAICPFAELDAVLGAIVRSLLGNSPNAVREAKRLVREVAGLPLTAALIDDTVARIAAIRASAEGREGVRAFLEKRKPSWLGIAGRDER